MRSTLRRSLIFIAAITAVMAGTVANAQLRGILDSAKRAAEREVERSVSRRVGNAVGCAVGNRQCAEDARKNGDEVVFIDNDGNTITDESGNPIGDADDAQARNEGVGQGVWRNYDFTPGRRVVYASDWESGRVGRIPQDIVFVSGSMQLVELNGENVLEIKAASVFQIQLDEATPEDFSLEFHAQTSAPNAFIRTYFEPFTASGTAQRLYPSHYLSVWRGAGIDFQGNNVSGATSKGAVSEALTPVKFQIDDGYAIMYVGTDRVAQVPNAKLPSSNVIEFTVVANEQRPAYIKNISVAFGIDDPYDTLIAEKQFTTRGIYFDTGSDGLRPESTPVLQQLLDMLGDHEDLETVIIEGHTDNVGQDQDNLELSRRRAESVRTYLVGNGIDEDRLEAVGRGETQPITDNATEARRQENRRVVFKLP